MLVHILQVINRPQRRSKSCPSISRMHYTDDSYDPRYGLEILMHNWLQWLQSWSKRQTTVPKTQYYSPCIELPAPLCGNVLLHRCDDEVVETNNTWKTNWKCYIAPGIFYINNGATLSGNVMTRTGAAFSPVLANFNKECPASHGINGIQVLCMYPSKACIS